MILITRQLEWWSNALLLVALQSIVTLARVYRMQMLVPSNR